MNGEAKNMYIFVEGPNIFSGVKMQKIQPSKRLNAIASRKKFFFFIKPSSSSKHKLWQWQGVIASELHERIFNAKRKNRLILRGSRYTVTI